VNVPSREPTPRLRFEPDDVDAPPVAQAVSLAFAVLRAAQATRWDELGGTIPYAIDLEPAQIALLNEHGSLLRMLRYSPPKTGGKTSCIAVCPECGRWMFVATAAISSCAMKYACPGKPKKVAAARRLDAAKPVQRRAADLPAPDDQKTLAFCEDPVEPVDVLGADDAAPDTDEVDDSGYDANGDFDD
jgi:hypothetical protein